MKSIENRQYWDILKGNLKMASKKDFKIGDFVVYPTHGMGVVKEITKQKFANQTIEFIVVAFEKARMTLRIPTDKVAISGLRKISTEKEMRLAVNLIKSPPKIKRMMWSRRAAEYEEKINSGDPSNIAEVVRDLYCRANSKTEQSFSERQIYEDALQRLADEYSAIFEMPNTEAVEKMEKIMEKKFNCPIDPNMDKFDWTEEDRANIEELAKR